MYTGYKCVVLYCMYVIGAESAGRQDVPLVRQPSELGKPPPGLGQLLQRGGRNVRDGGGLHAARCHDHDLPSSRTLPVRASRHPLLHVPPRGRRRRAVQRHDLQVDPTLLVHLP